MTQEEKIKNKNTKELAQYICSLKDITPETCGEEYPNYLKWHIQWLKSEV